mgnify:CR=1 FL=1
MSSYRKLARKQAFRLGLAVTAMVGGITGLHTAAYADGATDIQKMDAANAGTITTSNNVWTVVPDKVEGDLATNAFSKFILDQNNVANLQMYKGGATANTLVNMVQGHIDIRGTVNVLRNATTIGGNVFFLSPEGMAVGRTGVINAGSITALTPSTDWFNDHLQDNRVKVTAADMDAPQIWHAIIGPVVAEKKYGIAKPEILSAIRWHTTGRREMSLLEKIVFTADYIEPNRDRADNLAEMRYLAFQDLDFCVYRITADTLRYLASKQIRADQKTEECYQWLKEVKKYDDK